MRILIADIETLPALAFVWGLRDQNIGLDQVYADPRMAGMGYKWLGEKKTHWLGEYDMGHGEMVSAIHGVLDQADVVVHFNGTTFDVPWIETEFKLAKLAVPRPFKQVDLYRVVRQRFRFLSNKLQYVTTRLGLEGKMSHSGFKMWAQCYAGDPKAWADMGKYCQQDVRVTEELYLELRPWIRNHPNPELYGKPAECRCGAVASYIKDGVTRLAAGSYQQYRCRECGAWARDAQRLQGTDLRGVTQ